MDFSITCPNSRETTRQSLLVRFGLTLLTFLCLGGGGGGGMLQSQTNLNELGQEASSPPPPTFNDHLVIFSPFLSRKTRYFPTLLWRDGGYVIQFKCPNHFKPGL